MPALIRAGESVKTVQVALRHVSGVETLQIYVGLWPDNDKRTRAAIDNLDLNQSPVGAARDISSLKHATRSGELRCRAWCRPELCCFLGR